MTFYKGSDSFFVKRSFIPRHSRKPAIGSRESVINSEPSGIAIVKMRNKYICVPCGEPPAKK
ncbi:hypothetical protein A4R26_09840 [Niastella populi]|uniref:Uncharacterized protein n=1 Tax=Niastella populi TaxID=550983 RepID=A0A1V9EI11_9BACT|nr:hypothetical protein A4R26_09840 [Niastella populi]